MNLSRRKLLQTGSTGALIAGTDLASWLGARPAEAFDPGANNPAVHFLNRTSWGARPDDVRLAATKGIAACLDEQLNPERLNDTVLRKKMARFRVLEMQRARIMRLDDPYGQSGQALIHGMVTRAVFSKAQLLERLVEFWSDHFNVASAGLEVDYVIFQREAIRKHALGKFHDLLLATAQSPAMLIYLDNFLNVASHPNENYSREVMELHTLGVLGGYTETDVREVARALTGWTTDDKDKGGNFIFRLADHDMGRKRVLGVDLPPGRGIEDGLDVLRILASHPSTARFVCRKLCVRFVSDNPPDTLIDAMTDVWMRTDGAIKPVLRTLFLSPEFADSPGQRLRRPLDLVIGAMRAASTEVKEFWVLYELLQGLAQVPYDWHPPNGYPDVAGAWVNTGALLARWNAVFMLTDGAYNDPKGMTTALATQTGRPVTVGELVKVVSNFVFGVPLPESERQPYITFASDGMGAQARVTRALLRRKLGALYGLMLASPSYQWR